MLELGIKYHVKEGAYTFSTNIKREVIKNILSEVIRGYFGAEKDTREPIDRDIYLIWIEWDLSDDSYTMKSDTGNKELTIGILGDILKKEGK